MAIRHKQAKPRIMFWIPAMEVLRLRVTRQNACCLTYLEKMRKRENLELEVSIHCWKLGGDVASLA